MTPQLYALRATARTFLLRYHASLFIVSIFILLIVAASSLYLITTTSTTTTAADNIVTGFNQKTVDQIRNLRDSTDSPDKLVFPSPRSNPFVEK